MDQSKRIFFQEQCLIHNQCRFNQNGGHCIYYCGDSCELVGVVRESNQSSDELPANQSNGFNQCYPYENRKSAGAEQQMFTTNDAAPNMVDGQEVTSHTVEIIKAVDDLLDQATSLKHRLVNMLTKFQTKVCKCVQMTCHDTASTDNTKTSCNCSFRDIPQRNRAGLEESSVHSELNLPNWEHEELTLPAMPSIVQLSNCFHDDTEEDRRAYLSDAPMLSTTSAAKTRHPGEVDIQAPGFEQQVNRDQSRLVAGGSATHPSAIFLAKKEHPAIQLRDVSEQLLHIQEEIQVLREQIVRVSCETPCGTQATDTDAENMIEEVMSSNLIGRADEIKQTLAEIKSDCYQKLSPSLGVLSQLGEKRVHEKIEREIKRDHPEFSRTINQVKLTTGEKILDENGQHTTFDQIYETKVDTQRKDGSVVKNIAFKVTKKIDEKIRHPNSEGECKQTLKLSQKLITTEDKTINEKDTTKEQQISSAEERTIESRRRVTRTEQVAGREPLTEVLLNVKINRTIDKKTGEVVETMQELSTDSSIPSLSSSTGNLEPASPTAIAVDTSNKFQPDQTTKEEGSSLASKPIVPVKQDSSLDGKNIKTLPSFERSKAGSIAHGTEKTAQTPVASCVSGSVASYFEIIPEERPKTGDSISGTIEQDKKDNKNKDNRIYDIARSQYVDESNFSKQNTEYNEIDQIQRQSEQRTICEEYSKLQTKAQDVDYQHSRYSTQRPSPQQQDDIKSFIRTEAGEAGFKDESFDDRNSIRSTHTKTQEVDYQRSKYSTPRTPFQQQDDIKSLIRSEAGEAKFKDESLDDRNRSRSTHSITQDVDYQRSKYSTPSPLFQQQDDIKSLIRSEAGEAKFKDESFDDRNSNRSTHTKTQEVDYQRSKYSTPRPSFQQQDDLKSLIRSEAGEAKLKDESFEDRNSAAKQRNIVSRTTENVSQQKWFSLEGEDNQSKFDEKRSTRPGSVYRNESRIVGSQALYDSRNKFDKNISSEEYTDNEGRYRNSRYNSIEEWYVTKTEQDSKNASEDFNRSHLSKEKENEERQRYNYQIDDILLSNEIAHDPSKYQNVPKMSIADHPILNSAKSLAGPYYYKVQSELRLLTDSQLDRLCAERKNRRILAGGYLSPEEATVFDGFSIRQTVADGTKGSYGNQYNDNIPSSVAKGSSSPKPIPSKRPLYSTSTKHSFTPQIPPKGMTTESHFANNPQMYYPESVPSPLDRNNSESKRNTMLSEKTSEMLIKQDLRVPYHEMIHENQESISYQSNHLSRNTVESLPSRVNAGRNEIPIQYQAFETYSESKRSSRVSNPCSPSIKSVRIECIPIIIDNLSGNRCPKDFFITVAPDQTNSKIYRVNVINKQTGDILGFFLIDEDKFKVARSKGIFDEFLTLYVLNSKMSATNLEAADQPPCLSSCPCKRKN